MPACSSGTQTINLDCNSKLVSVTASAQSSGQQSVSIKDSNGETVFQANGASSSGGNFTIIGQGTFVTSGNGNYTVELTGGSGILSDESAAVYNGAPYLHAYTFATNDGGCSAGDRDFNDLVVSIIEFKNKG